MGSFIAPPDIRNGRVGWTEREIARVDADSQGVGGRSWVKCYHADEFVWQRRILIFGEL